MRKPQTNPFLRALTAVLLAILLMSFGFAGTSSPDTVMVASADELTAALSGAALAADPRATTAQAVALGVLAAAEQSVIDAA